VSVVHVRDLLAAVDHAMPFAWAEPWDRVGLLAGDPDAVVERVFVTLDPTPGALDAARAAGAQVLLTHHPAFLDPPMRWTAGSGMAGVPFAAVACGVALVAAHTNLDRAPEGADALPSVLGLRPVAPLEASAQPVSVLVTYVPHSAADSVLQALEYAGAGRIGRYSGCSFASDGEGRFTPLEGSEPLVGHPGVPSADPERRIEVVCPSGTLDAAVLALRSAHPYEEPVIVTGEAALSRGVARMGRVCETSAETLGELAGQVAARLGVRPRVYGDPAMPVTLAGTAPGSGRSLVSAARAAGCDVLVTGELRYHEALDAAASGLAVIEAGHDATEWPLVPVLAAAARASGLATDAVLIDKPLTNWWTAEGA